MITNGYIDENHHSYMTPFHPNSLAPSDKIFLRRIAEQSVYEPEYKLENPRLLIHEYLTEHDFHKKESLNNDILLELLWLENEIDQKASNFIETLFMQLNYHVNHEFLWGAFKRVLHDERHDSIRLFVSKVNRECKYFVEYLLTGMSYDSEKFSDTLQGKYILNTLYYSDVATIKSISGDAIAKLTEILARPNFLNIEEPDVQRLAYALNGLGVKVNEINIEMIDDKLLQAIYDNNLYAITYFNVYDMYMYMYMHEKLSISPFRIDYTAIMSQPDSPLAKYVSDDKHIDTYINMLVSTYTGMSDDEGDVISILNNPNVLKDTCEKYIELLKTPISKLSDIKGELLWEYLIKHKAAKPTEVNIIAYFREYTMTDELVDFINTSPIDYDFDESYADFDEATQRAFFVAVVESKHLYNRHYRSILKTLDWQYQSKFDIEGIRHCKMDILFELNVIQMASASLDFMRDNYQDIGATR